MPGYLSWVVDPAMPEVAAEVLSWFEGVAESAELTTTRARGLPPPSDGWTITTRSACWSLSGVPRRLGLARAANLAVLRAFREAGATSALVGPRGDDAYPVPARLYRSIGFEPGARTVTYHRPG